MNKITESVTLSTLNLPSPELRRRFSKPLMLCRRWHQCTSFLLPFQHIISISFSSFLSDFSLFIPSHLIHHFSLFYLTQWPIRISAFLQPTFSLVLNYAFPSYIISRFYRIKIHFNFSWIYVDIWLPIFSFLLALSLEGTISSYVLDRNTSRKGLLAHACHYHPRVLIFDMWETCPTWLHALRKPWHYYPSRTIPRASMYYHRTFC